MATLIKKFKDRTGKEIKTGQKATMKSEQYNPFQTSDSWQGHIIEKTVTTQYFVHNTDGDEVAITLDSAGLIKVQEG